MNGRKRWGIAGALLLLLAGGVALWTPDDDLSEGLLARLAEGAPPKSFEIAKERTAADLAAPVRLQADGKPINIGDFSSIAHAGPCIGDVDGDGDRDLLVGDFPGYFWLFENAGDEEKPVYVSKGKLKAGGQDAKTPVY